MVVYTFPPLYGGAGRQALRLAAYLQRRGVSALVLTARRHRGLPPKESLDGIPVVRLNVPGFRRLQPLFFFLSASCYLLRHGRLYDVYHIHGAYLRVIPVVVVGRLLGKRTVVKMTSQGTDDPASTRGRRWGTLLLWALRRVDAVVSVSRDMSAVYRESDLPPAKLVEIPNGVLTDVFCPATAGERPALRERLDLPRDAKIAVFVGFVGYQKGTDTLLLAWERVIERRPESCLLLLGPLREDAPEGSPSVRALVARSPRTILVGQNDNIHEYLKTSDVFVQPSRLEGLSNALLEAMSTGLACVASNIVGMGEALRHGHNGLLFPSGDAGALSDSILELLADDDKRSKLGKQARETIMERFSIDTVADRYASLYTRLLGPAEKIAGRSGRTVEK
jgi:glycosyltransferase involved in cell wall biosynthesis